MQFFSPKSFSLFVQTPLTTALRPLGSCACLRPGLTVKLGVFYFVLSSTSYLSVWLCNRTELVYSRTSHHRLDHRRGSSRPWVHNLDWLTRWLERVSA
jgi:hypothetical protein